MCRHHTFRQKTFSMLFTQLLVYCKQITSYMHFPTIHFRYYFQLLETEVLVAKGFLGIINYFKWKRIRIIAQDESVFIAVREFLLLKIPS